MKFSFGVLYSVLCAAFIAPAGANVATTAGSNLTAYNGTGATNNNQWNSLMNARGGMASTADANFGNCEAVILRCASPKCGSGCADVNIARPIVAGCVNSNATCKKHGDALIESLAMQLVAKSTAKAQEQANAAAIAQAQASASAAAASAANDQSNAQMQQMQQQMQQMQQQMAESMAAMQEQMAAQSEAQNAQIQNALESQRANTAPATVPAAETNQTGAVIQGLEGLGVAEQLAAKNGISADILIREQMGGQIETAIENATTAMKDLKGKLDAVLEYAGCDPSVTGCTGPKRVKKFKDLANEFFDPYENVVESVYDALILAMTVGINVNDVIMLLSDSCNIWGKYICEPCRPTGHKKNPTTGAMEPVLPDGCDCNDWDNPENPKGCYYRVITDANFKVGEKQTHCRLVSTLKDTDTVWREWIDANTGMTGSTQVACASDVVMSATLFRSMRKKTKAKLDIDVLRRLVNQDSYSCRGKWDSNSDKFVLSHTDPVQDCGLNMCAVDPNEDSDSYAILYSAVQNRKLPEINLKDKVGKSLCWESVDDAPNWIKNPELLIAKGRSAESVADDAYWDIVCAARNDPTECNKDNCVWMGGKCIRASSSIDPGAPTRTLGGLSSIINLGGGIKITECAGLSKEECFENRDACRWYTEETVPGVMESECINR